MPNSSPRLVLLTGATRGLGHAMTCRLAESGHTVLGCGRSQAQVDELRQRFPTPHRFNTVNVADDGQVRDWAQQILADYGPPDLILNNAGIINQNAPLWEVPADEFEKVVSVNLVGVANVIRQFVPEMVENRQGIIVNFSSGWGRSTSAEVAPYCATKWAVEGLTKALAQELPAGMAAIALNPGVINTQMLQSCFGSSAEHYNDADTWSRSAVPYLLSLTPSQNGQSLTSPM